MTTEPEPHFHVFNDISGYCECGLQYSPHLLPYFEHGGVIGEPPPRWMADTRQRFVTRLGPGDAVKTYEPPA